MKAYLTYAAWALLLAPAVWLMLAILSNVTAGPIR